MVIKITLTSDDGTEETMTREDSKWLFICVKNDKSSHDISLSGDDVNDSYLLRILENTIIKTMNQRNVVREIKG
jgi:hypothetical protein